MAMSKSNKIGLMIGVPFTLLVVGLLLYLHLFGQPDTEVAHNGFVPEGVVFDIAAPDAARTNLALADSHLAEIGYGVPRKADGSLNIGEGGITMCPGSGEQKPYPCRKGWVVITLWDQKMASTESEAGKALWNGDNPDHCTIMLPKSIEDALPIDALVGNLSEGIPAAELPPEIYAKVEAHEWVHCRGVGHVFTALPWPFYAIPTGALMHPNALKSGWGLDGIPQPVQP